MTLRTVGSHIATEDLLLALAIEDCENFDASNNEVLIKELAKQLLATIGDYIEVEEKIKREDKTQEEQKLQTPISFSEYASSALKKVVNTIGVVFDWLEHSTKGSEDKKLEVENKQKKEGLLKGLYNIVDLGLSLIGFLELACKFLDIPENPYKAKREHIRECLKVVQDQKQELFQLVNDATEILDSIIQEPKFNHAKALQFDNVVRQANDVIESCKDSLDTAMETIEVLTTNMTIFKWCSRGLRLTGWGLTFYVVYHFIPSSTLDTLALCVPTRQMDLIEKMFLDSKLIFVLKAAACAASGYMWMSLNPSAAYTFHDSLASLKRQHLRLTQGLKHLKRKNRCAQDVFDGGRKYTPS